MIEQILYDLNNFELVRDRVAQIIYNEITEQLNKAISLPYPEYEAFLNSFYDTNEVTNTKELSLFADRFIKPTWDELNIINIVLINEDLDPGEHISRQMAAVRLKIDVFCGKNADNESLGDTKSAHDCQKMLGILRAIIMHTNYIRLDFAPGFIQRRWAHGWNIQQPDELENRNNSNNIISGSLNISVNISEQNRGVTPIELEENYTNFYIDPEGKYKIETENLYT